MSKLKITLFYIFLCISATMASSLVYFLGKEWIIIRWPSYTTANPENQLDHETIKKKIRLAFWQHQRWNYETIEILWPTTHDEAAAYIIRSLLTLMEEEQVFERKVSLQTVVQSPSGNDLYISFDRTPFHEEASTFQKLMMLESILKTIRENGISTPNIYFLVHHQTMKDPHLDFSHAWPLEGFMSSHA